MADISDLVKYNSPQAPTTDPRPELPDSDGSRPNPLLGQLPIARVAINGFEINGLKQYDDQSTNWWANNAAAGTLASLTYQKMASRNQYYMLTVKNPSVDSALTVGVYQLKRGFAGGDQWSFLTAFNFPAGATESRVLEFPFVNDDMQLQFTNDSAISASGTFYASARLEILL